MGSIRSRSAPCYPMLVLLFVSLALAAWGQAPLQGESGLAAELRRLETSAADQKNSGGVRRAAYSELAQLRKLSGDMEGAAAAWSEAAFAEPGQRDDASLLNAAECLLILGEYEKAGADVKTVLLTGRDPASVAAARYLGAVLEALRPAAANPEPLKAFVDDAAYTHRRPGTLYMLWRVTGEAAYADRLRKEHPKSPEARISGSAVASPATVALAPSALWLLMGGRESITWNSPAAAPADAPAAAEGHASAKKQETAGPSVLQIGLFRSESNARTLAKRLSDAGFSAELQPRGASAGAYWAVVVPPGENVSELILRLKDAGFEAFPVFN